MNIRAWFRKCIRRLGVDIVRYREVNGVQLTNLPDIGEMSREVYDAVLPFTMTSSERVNALVEAVQYVVKWNISGAIVECGVWRGGSSMAAALTLNKLGIADRDIFLYDTFTGVNDRGYGAIS